jgi:hypothetical protein
VCVLVCVCARQRLPLAPGLHWNVICISNSTSWFAHCANLSPLLRPCVLGARRRDGRHKRSIFFSVELSSWFEIGLGSALCVCCVCWQPDDDPPEYGQQHTHTHTTINIFSHHPSSLLWMAFMQIYKDWPVWLSAAPNYYRIRFLSGLFFWHTTKIEFK